MIETDTTAIATVDEMELATETFEGLVEAQEYQKAVEIGEQIMNRVDSVSRDWQAKVNEIRPILKQRQWKIDNEVDWAESDERLALFKEHQPQLWALMQHELGRSAEANVRWLNIKGDETHACAVLEFRWDGKPSFCGQYSEDKMEMHLHWLREEHRKTGAWLKEYPWLEAIRVSSGKIHKDGKHSVASYRKTQKFYFIDGGLQMFGGWRAKVSDLCKQCFPKLKETCDDCGAPANNKGVCVMNHD